jgi:hypothetical protein
MQCNAGKKVSKYDDGWMHIWSELPNKHALLGKLLQSLQPDASGAKRKIKLAASLQLTRLQ